MYKRKKFYKIGPKSSMKEIKPIISIRIPLKVCNQKRKMSFGSIKGDVRPSVHLFYFPIRGQFHQRSTSSFCGRRSRKCKKDIQVISLFLWFWDLCAHKLLLERWCNWPQLSIYIPSCKRHAYSLLRKHSN